jgi:2-haloacid dehalogenase
MLVAAHASDLEAAAALGLRTAYVRRGEEWGPDRAPEPPFAGADIVADDLGDLGARLGIDGH